jgi:hypothetical protein
MAQGPSFKVVERLGEEWTDERLSFTVSLPEGLDPTALGVRADRLWSPAQFQPEAPGSRRGVVCFIASLAAFQDRTWELADAPRGMPAVDLVIEESGTQVSFGTSHIAVRCPIGKWSWQAGVPVTEVAPPVTATSVGGSGWREAGHLVGGAKVVSLESGVVEKGPVSAKIRLCYRFQGGGEWTVSLEAIAGQEVVLVEEHLNLQPAAGMLENVRPAGTPAGNYVMKSYGDRLRDKGTYWALGVGGCVAADRIAWQPLGTTWPLALSDTTTWGDFAVPAASGPIMTLHPAHGEWWLNASSWAGFYRRGREPYLGILALRAGEWKDLDENAIVIEKTPEGAIQAVLPVTIGARRWALYGATSGRAAPPPAVEPKPAERPGRDQARPPQLATMKYGLLPLDEVRNWAPDYADPAGLTYPQLFARRSGLRDLRERAAANPQIMERIRAAANAWSRYEATQDSNYPFHSSWLTKSMMLDDLFLATGNEQYVSAMAALLEARLHYHAHQVKAGVGTNGYRLGHSYGMFHVAIDVLPRAIREADVVLGSPSVSPTRKANIRAILSFWAELLTSADYQPPGRNNGNTDMLACRDVVIGAIGCLLPGHPKSASWRAVAATRIDNVLDARHHLPGATQDEWYGHLTLDLCVWSAAMLKKAGDRDFFADSRLQDGLDFYGQLLVPPDPRYGFGYIAPFGNGQAQWNRSAQWGIAAGATGRDHPEYAGRMAWYWARAGRPWTLKFLPTDDIGMATLAMTDDSIKPRNPLLSSVLLDGWGVVFRHECGARNETYLAMQAGKPGSLPLYNAEGGLHYHALGVPVSLIPGIRSYDVQVNGGQSNVVLQRWMANRPSFALSSEQDQGTGQIRGWIPSQGADYACAQWTFSRFEALPLPQPLDGADRLVLSSPRAIGNAGRPGVFTAESPVHWRRQMLFVKPSSQSGSPYVVIRDDVRASVPWDWNIWCLALRQQVTEQGIFFTGKFGVNLAVIPLWQGGEFVTGAYGPTQSFAGDYRQQLFQVRLPAKHRTYAALLYPWRNGEKAPKVIPDKELGGMHCMLEDETHAISSSVDGMALVREAANVKSVAIFGGLDRVETDGDTVALDGKRDPSGFVEIVFEPQTLHGETRGSGRGIRVESAKVLPGRVVIEGTPAERQEQVPNRVRFDAPRGQHRFRIE